MIRSRGLGHQTSAPSCDWHHTSTQCLIAEPLSALLVKQPDSLSWVGTFHPAEKPLESQLLSRLPDQTRCFLDSARLSAMNLEQCNSPPNVRSILLSVSAQGPRGYPISRFRLMVVTPSIALLLMVRPPSFARQPFVWPSGTPGQIGLSCHDLKNANRTHMLVATIKTCAIYIYV